MRLIVKTDKTVLERKLKQLPDVLNLGLRKGLQEFLFDVIDRARKKLTGDVLKVGRGWLRNSLYSQIEETTDRILGRFGTKDIVYARIHEFGGLILPRRSRYLAIPLPGTRFKPAEYLNTFVARSKAGNLLIFQKAQGRGGETIKPLFVLKKYVVMPERSYLRSSLNELIGNLPETIRKNTQKELKAL